MNREEVLAKSRKENKSRDLVDEKVTWKGAALAAAVMVIMSLVYYIAENAFTGRFNHGFFCLIVIYNAVLYLVKGILAKRKVFLITGILSMVCAIILNICYFNSLADLSSRL